MPARLENEKKIETTIQALLEDLPYYVYEWNMLMEASEMTASTRLEYTRKIKRFLSSINSDPKKVTPSDITLESVLKFYNSTKTKLDKHGNLKETSDSFKQTNYTVLNVFLNYMVAQGYIPVNYLNKSNVKRPKNHDLPRIRKERIKLDKRDFKLAHHKAAIVRDPVYRYRDSLILKLLMETGMRETALKIINISDIDFENKTLTTIDKGDKYEVYDLNSSAIEAINKWLEYRTYFEQYPSDALFLNYKGDRLSCKGITRIVDKYFYDAIGKHVSAHKIRGGVASIIYEETGDIEKVRRVLDHESADTSARYVSTDNNERKEAAKILEV